MGLFRDIYDYFFTSPQKKIYRPAIAYAKLPEINFATATREEEEAYHIFRFRKMFAYIHCEEAPLNQFGRLDVDKLEDILIRQYGDFKATGQSIYGVLVEKEGRSWANSVSMWL